MSDGGTRAALVRRVSMLLAAGHYAAAAGLVRGIATTLQGSADAPQELAGCGRAFLAAGHPGTAVDCYEKALLAATGDAAQLDDLMGWLGLAYTEVGDSDKATSLRASMLHGEADASIGLLLLNARHLAGRQSAEQTARLYLAALARSEGNLAERVWVHVERGRWLRQEDQPDAAAQDFQRAERLAGLLGDRLLIGMCTRVASGADAPSQVSEHGEHRLYVRLLGGFDVRRGATSLDAASWPRRKAAVLLQYLALQPQWRAPMTRLIELVWGGESDANAFHVTAHALRQRLCDGLPDPVPYLQVSDGIVGLNASLIAGTDVQEFRACIQAARTYWDDDRDREAALQSYRQARAAYAGELLVGSDSYWVLPMREMLSSMYVEALLRLAQANRSEGLSLCLEASELEPANVEALINVTSMLVAVGRKKQAIDLYLRYETYARNELGIEPVPELRRLYRQLIGEGRGDRP